MSSIMGLGTKCALGLQRLWRHAQGFDPAEPGITSKRTLGAHDRAKIIQRCTRERDTPSSRLARKRSSRSPAAPTVSISIVSGTESGDAGSETGASGDSGCVLIAASYNGTPALMPQ
ncbi:MAG: hypothetical protein R3E83_17315 [Burkholderiaceae bacterium]